MSRIRLRSGLSSCMKPSESCCYKKEADGIATPYRDLLCLLQMHKATSCVRMRGSGPTMNSDFNVLTSGGHGESCYCKGAAAPP